MRKKDTRVLGLHTDERTRIGLRPLYRLGRVETAVRVGGLLTPDSTPPVRGRTSVLLTLEKDGDTH